ncbi:MAG: CoA transferase [Alphaproteobacteria bacterium]|nr:CoA transferase [Alphaproteobacteria bacterium]
MSDLFRPLEGVRVLDLSRYLPGPFLTRILADLGAEVIKVEPPTGEGLRWMPPRAHGMGVTFGSLNAGKASLALDLKKPEAQALIHALLPEVDVLVEGFRPGVMDRLGLPWATLLDAHPRLIGVSLSGFGQSGPLSQRAGHDLGYVARAGVLGLFGPADGPPSVPGVQMADVAGGTLPAAIGVLGALLERARTGRGRHLDISLTRGVFSFATYAMAQAAAGHTEPRGAGVLTGGVPCCRCYATADDRHLAFTPLEPDFYALFCTLVDRPDLAGRGYEMGRGGEQVADALAAIFRTRTLAEWEAFLDGHDVCVEPVRTPAEAAAHPEFEGVIKDAGGVPVVQLAIGVPPEALPTPAPPSPLGADGAAVLARLGVAPAIVAAARDADALLLPEAAPPGGAR